MVAAATRPFILASNVPSSNIIEPRYLKVETYSNLSLKECFIGVFDITIDY